MFVALVIGRRVLPRDWFEHSIAEFGESQGMLATGFVMVDMVDPARQTDSRQGLQLSADPHVPHSRRRLRDGAGSAFDRGVGTAGIYDSDRGHHRCIDGRGVKRIGHVRGQLRQSSSA